MNTRMLTGRLFVFVGTLLLASAPPAHAATFTVNSTVDETDIAPGDGVCLTASAVCTLRAAVMEANILPGADNIIVPAGTYTLTLAGLEGPNDAAPKFGDLDITEAVTIAGSGASATVVEAGATLATAVGRVFDLTVPALQEVAISGITVRHGDAGSIGTILHCGGGGIANRRNGFDEAGVLNLTDSIVTNNTAHNGGGLCNLGPGAIRLVRASVTDNVAFAAVDFTWGGGIKNMSGGSLFINESTISDNRSDDSGGGIANIHAGRFEIANSTISGNLAAVNGGGLVAAANSLGSLWNVTVTDNSAVGPAADIGGVAAIEAADVSIRHTVIADNHAPSSPDCRGVATLGYNRIGIAASTTAAWPRCIGAGFEFSDQVGDDAAPLDLRLGPLTFNGGPTRTHALLDDSPALDAGDPVDGCRDRFGVLFPTDQRGQPRPAMTACDIGAYEKQPFAMASVVSAAATTGAGIVTFEVTPPLAFASLDPVSESDLPTEGKPATAFPFGFFSWTVTGLGFGDTIVVTITHPSPVAAPAEYWKVIGTTWTNVTALLGDDDGDEVLTLTLTDGGLGDADGIVNGQISDPGGTAPGSSGPPPSNVAFADFDATLNVKRREAKLKADFVLGAGSDGIAPPREDVTLSIGSFSTTIPAGSFHARKNGRFEFDGVISGVTMKFVIDPLHRRRFALKADLRGADLTGAGDPVTVRLTIGNDSGSTAARNK